MKRRLSKQNKGFSLIEVLFYLSLFAMLSIVIVQSSVILTNSFRVTKTNLELAQASSIMERISREVRQARSISTISSNSLKLANQDGTVQFTLSSGDILFYVNDVLVGNLNPENIDISALEFTQINTVNSSAVKIYLALNSNNFNSNKTAEYYNTVVLRGSY